jgi:hypothetical protein
MLARYRKAGGFVQLLKVIETCGKAKQDNFLKMIQEEDPKWADALREKTLSIEKICSWDDNTVGEIAVRLNQMTLATALHGLPEAAAEKFTKMMSHSQKRAIEDAKKAKDGNAGEVSAAFLKIIEEVRKMINDGELKLDKFAPELIIPEAYEEKLGKNKTAGETGSPTSNDAEASGGVPNLDGFGPKPAGHTNGSGGPVSADVNTLRQKIQSLSHENNALKNELKIAKDKLMQIKRIA